MNGNNLLVDTNIIINLLENKGHIEDYIGGNAIYISVITEIELLGWYKITEPEKKLIQGLLNDCNIIDLLQPVKKLAITIKQKQKVKLPDAIIAATSIYFDMPLMTFDKAFAKIENLNSIIIE